MVSVPPVEQLKLYMYKTVGEPIPLPCEELDEPKGE